MTISKQISMLLLAAFVTTNSGAATMANQQDEYRFGRFSEVLPRMSRVTVDASYLGTNVRVDRAVKSPAQFKEVQDALAHRYDTTKMDVASDGTADLFRAGGMDPDKLFGDKQLVSYNFDASKQESFIAYREDPRSSNMIAMLSRYRPSGVVVFDLSTRLAPQVQLAQSDLQAAANTFRFNEPGTPIPSHAFCISSGCFDDGARPTSSERAQFRAVLAGRKDVVLTIQTIERLRLDQGFNDIEKNADDEIAVGTKAGLRTNVLKRGKRTMVGQQGYEIALSTRGPGEERDSYVFVWAAAGEMNNPLKPIIDFDLRIEPTDDGESTVANSEEAERLWESLIAAFKVR